MKRHVATDHPANAKIADQEHSSIGVNDNNGNPYDRNQYGDDHDEDVTRNGNFLSGKRNYNYKTFGGGEHYAESRLEDGYDDDDDMQIATEGKMEATYTMQEALDLIGFGPYQVLLSAYFGLIYMADSMETMLVSVLVPAMRCVFKGVDPFQQALLPMCAVVGLLVSGAFWGKIGDRYGRKTTMFISNALCGYFGVLSAFSPSYPWVLINRFFVSFALGAFPQIVAFYGEFLPTKSRSTCIITLALIWAVGSCLEVSVAMVTLPSLQWRLFLVLSSVPIVLLTFVLKLIPESPRHLLAHGRYDEAVAVLKQVAKLNRKKLPEGRLRYSPDVTLDKNKLSDLFVPKYRKTTIIMAFATAAISMAYYGTALLSATLFDKRDGCHGYERGTPPDHVSSCEVYCQTLTRKDYIDLLFTTLGEAPGVLICVLTMAYFSRKTSLAMQMVVFTLAVAACNFCAPRNILVGLLFLARAMGDGAAQGGLLYATEVYPTSIRAIAMGWVVSFKGLGYLMSAISANIFLGYSSFLAISSLAASGLVGAICFIILPYETKNRKMLDTLDENVT